MSTQKRTRRENSAAESSNQTSNPAVLSAPLLEKLRQGIGSAISTIDMQFAEAPGEYEQILLLSIRQDLSPLLDLLEAEPSNVPTPPGPAIAPSSGNQAATPARTESGGAEAGKQPAMPQRVSITGVSPLMLLNASITHLLRHIHTQLGAEISTQEKITLLEILQIAEWVQGDAAVLTSETAKNAVQDQTPPAQPSSVVAPPGADPFPLCEDPQDVQAARFHIRDFYETAENEKHEDGFSSLINLRDCIVHHPGLKVEAEALQMLVDGSNALNSLGFRHNDANESDRGFTGAEVLLVNFLSKTDENVTMKDYLRQLRGATYSLRANAGTTELANTLDRMFQGRDIMRKLNVWLQSI